MGIISLLEKRQAQPWDDYWYLPRIRDVAAGVDVDEDSMLGVTAVWCSIGIITSALAKIPLRLYRRMSNGGREPVTGDPRYWMTFRQPNRWQTAYTWREMLQGHILMRGNCYAQKVVGRDGITRELIPLNPTRMTVKLGETDVEYHFRASDGSTRVFRREEILHVHGLSSNGFTGLSPITAHREALAAMIAGDRYAAIYFKNSATPPGILKTPNVLKDETFARAKEEWQVTRAGVENAHKTPLLEGGLEFQALGFSPEDSQMIQSRTFNVLEAARIFNVPPHKIMEMTHATFSNIEQQDLAWIGDTIHPWSERWEQQLDASLLREGERETLFFKFDLKALLRGDSAARSAYFQARYNVGSITANEIRALDDENPLPIPEADEPFIQMAMVPLRMAGVIAEAGATSTDTPPEPDDDEDRAEPPQLVAEGIPEAEFKVLMQNRAQRAITARLRHRQAFEALFRSAAARVLGRELVQLKRALKDGLEGDAGPFLRWIETFYPDHERTVAETFLPVLATFGESVFAEAVDEITAPAADASQIAPFVRDYADALGVRWSRSSANQLRKIVRESPADAVHEAIETRAEEWGRTRAAKEGRRESYRSANALTMAAYMALGVQRMIVRTRGGCELCAPLDGFTVSIGTPILKPGDTLGTEGGETTPMVVRQTMTHPPFHKGCDCYVVAA